MSKITEGDTVDQREILIKLVSYSQIEFLPRDYSYILGNYEDVSKYASKNAVNAELGHYPILHKAWGLAVKYWLRLENVTENANLNEAFLQAKTANHDWIQSVQYIWCKNGFRNILYGSILWIVTNKPSIKCLFNDLTINIAKISKGS